MTITDHPDPVGVATDLVARAYRKALAQANAHPESTWVDAACAIGAAEAQLLATQPAAVPRPPADGTDRHTCLGLLLQAEQSLAGIPAGTGPVALALVRAYLSDAITETTGREP